MKNINYYDIQYNYYINLPFLNKILTSMTSLSSRVKKIAPADLATDDIIVIDVRTPSEFDRAHYTGAISLYFPMILWRRLLRQKNKNVVLDEFLLSDIKTILKKRHTGTRIVLYDESTRDLCDCPSTDPLVVLCEILSVEESTKCAFVEGGFQAIQSACPSSLVATPVVVACTTPSIMSSPTHDVPRDVDYFTLPLNFFLDDFVAIGAEANAHDIALLERHNITHILNVTATECPEDVKKGRSTLQISVNDSMTQNIVKHFAEVIEFIHTARSIPNSKLLIHCHAGISRSVSFAVAYVMWAEKKELGEALEMIRTHRQCASPNLNFLGQLMIFGNFLPSSPAEAAARTIEQLAIQ